MKEQLLWRIEYKDKGPFSDSDVFDTIRSSVLRLGPKADDFGTTFLNIYDQNTNSPYMVKEFRPYTDYLIGSQYLRFGFNSKEILEEQLRISDEDVKYGSHVWFQQFVRLLNSDEDFKIKVYLAKPLVSSKTESIFEINQSELVETIDDIETFTRS